MISGQDPAWGTGMGEKGNVFDVGQELFENLAEQGSQFWLDYEQFKLTRAKGPGAEVMVEQRVQAHDPDAQRPGPPAAG
jgi:hypothetical protein